MGRDIPVDGGGSTVAPISDDTIEAVAEDMDYDVGPDAVRSIVDAFQTDASQVIGLYREGDSQVVAEDEDVLVTLSKYDYGEEIDQFLDGRFDELAADALGVDPSVRREVIFQAISYAHHGAFGSAHYRTLTGFSEQDVTGATSASYPRVIRKPDEAKPTAGDLDIDYRIQYDHGYEHPWNFVGRASATIHGDMGTLPIKRTYRAIPDDDGDWANVVQISSKTAHTETETPVDESIDEFTLEEFGVETGHKGRVDQFDSDLRYAVYENHTADFEAEYEQLDDVIQTCEECGAFEDVNNGVHVNQRQRPSYGFNPARKETLCNHCFADFVDATTLLSRQEAEVHALKHSGCSHREVSTALNMDQSTVGTVVRRISEKVERAKYDEQRARATAELDDS